MNIEKHLGIQFQVQVQYEDKLMLVNQLLKIS